jgi:hypothetical protein
MRSHTDLPRRDAPYPLIEDENVQSRRNERCTLARDQEVTTRGRSRTGYRPPYVREATDRGTERALMPSPRHSHEKLFYPDTNDSDITEEIERVERHVTFRDSGGYDDGYDILIGKIGSAQVFGEDDRR